MKFCQQCGTSLDDVAKFCVKCGTPCVIDTNIVSTSTIVRMDSSKYYGMTFKDIFGKIIELTPQGVYIYRHKSISLKFDNVIPYKHILNINFSRPSFSNRNGYLSIVTANGGLSADYVAKDPMSFKASKEMCDNQNVVSFRKKQITDIQAIYDALIDILNN